MSIRQGRAKAVAAVAFAVVSLLVLLVLASVAAAGTLYVKTCGSFGLGALRLSPPPAGIRVYGSCPGGPITMSGSGTGATAGARETFSVTAPPGIAIVHFWIDNGSLDVTQLNDGTGFGGGSYWAGGGAQFHFGMHGYSSPYFLSSYAGVQIVCGLSNCTNYASGMAVKDFNVQAVESNGPSLLAVGPLYYEKGWIRGVWNLSFAASDPSGVCNIRAFSVGPGQFYQGAQPAPDPSVFHQCPDEGFSRAINTASIPDGAQSLVLQAQNAAGEWSTAGTTEHIDNQPVSIQMSGPGEASSAAGVQYIAATAAAGISGVSGIGCSLDGAPWQWYPQASVLIPVAGVGVHHLSCYGANNARDASGNAGTSTPATRTLSIRKPTVAGISFGTRTLNPPLCQRVRERVQVPARWVTVRRHHKLVQVRRRAHTKTVKVIRCHPRVVTRRVRIHGHWRRERLVLLPHTVQQSTVRVRHGAASAVTGWLGTSDGTALAGQPVRITTAPDNGLNRFTQVGAVTTALDGTWIGRLPPGPSRLVQAVYDGGSLTEPTSSATIQMTVPASIKLLSVSPHHVAWGGTVHIVGQLRGGYLPSAGALVRLRIGFGSAYTTYGVQEHVTGDGRFSTTYTFGAGVSGVVRRYWFSLASLPVGDYPYAPARSRRIYVTVG